MASIQVDDATITVEGTGLCDPKGHPIYEWAIVLDDDREWGDSDLAGGRGKAPTETEMLGTLLAFLTAAMESRDYRIRTGREGENEDLFPADLLDWACERGDEISLAEFELNEGAEVDVM